jgi:hypothetical protein
MHDWQAKNIGLPLKTDSAFQDRHDTEPIPLKAR